jgi:hypothetical protein
MSHKLFDFVKQGSISTGATTIALTVDAERTYRNFSEVMEDGDTTEVTIVNRDVPSEWQAAIYRYEADVLTFVRLSGSSTASAVTFSAGLKDVYIAPLAKRENQPILIEGPATFEAFPGDVLRIDTTGGAVTVNLPDDPAEGDKEITLTDAAGTWGTNNVTLDAGTETFPDGGNPLVCADTATFTTFFHAGVWQIR